MAKSKMQKALRAQKLIPIIGILLVLVGIAIVALIFTRNEKVPPNPEYTVGNTAGNLNNKGYFCEANGIVYFANPNDGHHLYSMDPLAQDFNLIKDVPVSYISSAGNYLYFYYDDRGDAKFMGVAGNMRGVYRLISTGKGALNCLERTTSGIVNLIGNKVYYQHYDNEEGMTLYSATTDGREVVQVAKEIINPSCVINGNIYYPDQKNMFYVNVLYPSSGGIDLYMKERMYNPAPVGDCIYYMNVADDYKLYKYSMSESTITKLTNDRVDAFNVYDNYIFYQKNGKDAALIRMQTDGSNPEIISEGQYTDINCTSTYTYFRPFDDEELFYMTPTLSAAYVTRFEPPIGETSE